MAKRPLKEFIDDLKSGKIDPEKVDPIRVVEINGKLISLDNRRLFAFQQAGIKSIPVKKVSIDDPLIREEFFRKTNGKLDGYDSVNVVNTEEK